MSSGEEMLKQFLMKNQHRRYPVQYIRLQWIDFSGILRARFVPVDRCFGIAKGDEDYHVPQVSMIIPVSTAPKCFPTSDDIETWALRPDWSSLRLCGFRPSHASVMCFLEHKEVSNWERKCPRALLSRALTNLETQWDIKVLFGFEIEFMLLDKNYEPLDQLDRLNSYQTTAGLRGKTLDIVEEIIDHLKESAINIYHFHTETQDQIEFALSPESPLAAIDSLILAQETIRTVFLKYDIKATMTPKPLINGPTNGIHLHMSVNKSVPQRTEQFLAGILDHMSSLCAFGMANFDSYSRIGKDAAGTWIGYGTENRDFPVRKINERHWEFRMMDSTCNPYMFAGAVLLAGMDGLLTKRDLVWKDCRVFPHKLTDAERAEYQLNKKMPVCLEDALIALRANISMRKWSWSDLLDAYISVKEKEVKVFGQMDETERRLRFLEYF